MASSCRIPDESSIDAFVAALETHDTVTRVARRSGTDVVDIELQSGRILAVFMTNIYVVGEADLQEIQRRHVDINAIVTLSAWNMTSEDAVKYGRERKIGVFTWKEFFGAIN